MTTPWPALSFEDRPWTSHLDDPHLDIFQRHLLSRSYQAAVTPPIADLTPVVGQRTTDLVAEATADVARFDEEMAHLPVGMPAVLLRTESASSSQIEHLTASARNLAMASLGVPGAAVKENAELVAANVRAMREALAGDPVVTMNGVLRTHEALLQDSDPGIAGRWRTEQVWVGSSSVSPHRADFVPPHHERVPAAMEDLVAFAARTDIPALVHAAVVHAQFETIHPFVDGNGRTGRVVLQTVLRAHDLVRHSPVPVSAGLLRNTGEYFAALTEFRAGDVDPVVGQVAKAALAAVENGRLLGAELEAVRETWRAAIRARSDSTAWRLADALFEQPVVNAEYVSRTLRVSDRAARNAVQVLVEAGVLVQPGVARRYRVWQASDVLAAADRFAARAGRRRPA